jgi:hypothetical protein
VPSIWSPLAEEIGRLTASAKDCASWRGQEHCAWSLAWKMGRFGGRTHHIPPSLALISFYLCGTAIQLKESISWKWRSHSFKHWNRATKQTWKCALACLPMVSSWDSTTSNDWGITVKQFARPTFVQIVASLCDFHSLVIHTVWCEMAGVLCCRMLSHKAKIVSMDLVLLHSNGIICLNSLVVCPAAAVQIIGRMPRRPRLDWRVHGSRPCAKICS